MNLKNLESNFQLRHLLAGEYVLGTLRGGARRRFEGWLKQDKQLLQLVRQWEAHLLPLAELSAPSLPSPRVWDNIRQRTGIAQTNKQSGDRLLKLFDSLSFWRSFGLTAAATALVLFALLINNIKNSEPNSEPTFGQNQFIATLVDEKLQTAALITADIKHSEIIVRVQGKQTIRQDQSLELWAIAEDGKVRSLGLIADAGQVKLKMPDFMKTSRQKLLAISLEPKGGSGNPEQPSGPILFKGQYLSI